MSNTPPPQAPIGCEACDGLMRPINGWSLVCPRCGFQMSLLTPSGGAIVPGLDALRRQNFERLLDRLERVMPLAGARLLEVGSATGLFLEAAARRGALVHGLEPNEENAALARAKGFASDCGLFPQDAQTHDPYDVIVFNDVFEHIPQPSRAIQDVQALLKPGGIAVLNYPSSNGVFFFLASRLARIGLTGPLERLWQKGFSSPHVSYFNPAVLEKLVRRHSAMTPLTSFRLDSVSRIGLAERIRPSHKGLKGAVILAAVYALSFLLPLLPPDIQVTFLRRP